MAMVVKNNMSAVSTLNTLNKNSSALQKSLSKVSSGMKINSAQDDASGYAISERMRVQIRSLDQANQNTQNGSSMMKTAEGAVSSTVEILKSLKEKAINSANDTNKDADRVTIQKEIDQFIDQIDDNALTTFNGKYLVDGSKSQYGKETYTTMTNQSLSTSTAGTTRLTELANRNGDSLEIASTDYVTASFVRNGETYTTKYRVENTDLATIFNNLNSTFQTANSGNANSTVSIFGSAQTDVSAASAAYTDTASALADLEAYSGTANVGAAATGTGDTATTINAAVKYLIEEGSTATDTIVKKLTGVTGGYTQAKSDLKTAIGNNMSAVTLSVANTTGDGGVFNSSTTAATATVTVGSTSASATNTSSIADSNTGSIVVDASAASATVVANVEAVTDPSDTAALVTASTMAYSVSLPTGKNGGLVSDSGTALTAANDQTVLDSYAAASLAKIVVDNNQPTGASAQVINREQVGINAAGDAVYTANGEKGVTVTAADKGITNQISGLTISITDSEGNVKKSANASLDDFSTTIYAKNASSNNELSFQVGASANQAIAVGLEDMRSEALGLKGSDGTKVSVATQDKANAAIAVFDNAINKALDQQTTIGAIEARLEYTSSNLTTSSENVQAAESTIRDADMAKEMTNYTKNNVLLQAAQSMLAQANQSSSAVLSLLQ